MRAERTRRTLRLRLFAFVLALALAWYILNPSPRSLPKDMAEREPPDEKRREIEAEKGGIPVLLAGFGTRWLEQRDFTISQVKDDDFEWPEFIDG